MVKRRDPRGRTLSIRRTPSSTLGSMLHGCSPTEFAIGKYGFKHKSNLVLYVIMAGLGAWWRPEHGEESPDPPRLRAAS